MRQSGSDEKYTQSGMEAGNTLNEMLAEGRSYSGRERNCCFLNTGGDARSGGRFANISAASGLDLIDDGRAIGLVDWDHDGDIDLWISNRNAPRLRLMRNDLINRDTNTDEAGSASHFVALRLVGNGETANRDSIGARVELIMTEETDGQQPRSIQTLRAGDGFLAQSSKWMHFGLGKNSKIEKAIVHWPCQSDDDETGTVSEEFPLPRADRRYELVQGSGTATELDTADRTLALNAQVPENLPANKTARIPLHVLLPAPRIEFQSFDDRQRFKPVNGTPLLVNLWSSTCGPCLKELADFNQRADDIRAAGIEVLALSVDGLMEAGEPSAAEQVLTRMQFAFDSGMATQSLVEKFQDLYDHLMPLHSALPIPTSLLIDGQGQLAVVYKGPVSVEQLIEDKTHSSGSSVERFHRSAALAGRLINSELINASIVRQEAAARDLYAKKLERAGFADQAATQYREVLKLKPDYSHAQHFVGRLLTDQGRWTAARNHYQHAVDAIPDDPDLHSMLANIYLREKNLERAKKHCQAAVNINPTNAIFRISLGNVHMQLGQRTEAKTQYEEAVRAQPDSPEARVSLGNVLMQDNELEPAKVQYQAALRINPNFAQAALNLGTIYLFQEDLENAKQCFEQAVRAQPNYAQAHFNLGRVLAQQRDFEQAKVHLQQTLNIQPNHAEARALLTQLNRISGQ